jgi:hypothetical protein
MNRVNDKAVKFLGTMKVGEWTIVGPSKPVSPYWRKSYKDAPSKAALRGWASLGLIQVRTINISNWHSDPPIDDISGAWVEAKLLPQGHDVLKALT